MLDETYDVFISYAREDQYPFVHNLAGSLRAYGLSVWYDHLVIKLGQSLREAIDSGVRNSHCAILVLSPHYFKKLWTNRELDALLAQESVHSTMIMPIWHNVSFDDVQKFSPLIASKVARSSDEYTFTIAQEIRKVVQPQLVVKQDIYDGRTVVIVVEEHGVMFVNSTCPPIKGRQNRLFEFSGREIDYNYFAKALTPSESASGRMFTFNGKISLVRVNQQICSHEDAEEGIIVDIGEPDNPLWCYPIYVSHSCTLAIVTDEIIAAVSERGPKQKQKSSKSKGKNKKTRK